jgi:RNA polymerase sigma-70 factor (ECF subfamily)
VDQRDQGDIQASLGGDEQAFARLIKRYEQQVADLMWRFTRDAQQLSELVQDVFVEVYFSLPKYRGDAPLVHWIRKIATRAGYRFWKARSRRRNVVSIRDYDRAVEIDATDPSRAAAVLDGLLARLAPAERLVLTLQYLEQLSGDEIARRMGWTKAMVKMRAYRARKKLRQIASRDKTIEDMKWKF